MVHAAWPTIRLHCKKLMTSSYPPNHRSVYQADRYVAPSSHNIFPRESRIFSNSKNKKNHQKHDHCHLFQANFFIIFRPSFRKSRDLFQKFEPKSKMFPTVPFKSSFPSPLRHCAIARWPSSVDPRWPWWGKSLETVHPLRIPVIPWLVWGSGNSSTGANQKETVWFQWKNCSWMGLQPVFTKASRA